jgi:hypothetical protein
MHSHLLCTLAAERSQELRRASASSGRVPRYVDDEEPLRRIARLRFRVGRLTTRFAEMRS